MTIRMLQVAGLVITPTSTRLAVITRRVSGVCVANTSSITSARKRADTLVDRYEQIIDLRNEILYVAALAELVVIEDTARASGGSSLDRHGLWWVVVSKLLDHGVPVAVCTPIPSTAKTAKATAPLDDPITLLWPGTRLSAPQEARALVLAHGGASHLGWDVPAVPPGYQETLGAITWPESSVTAT